MVVVEVEDERIPFLLLHLPFDISPYGSRVSKAGSCIALAVAGGTR